jgi:hypothetical protein
MTQRYQALPKTSDLRHLLEDEISRRVDLALGPVEGNDRGSGEEDDYMGPNEQDGVMGSADDSDSSDRAGQSSSPKSRAEVSQNNQPRHGIKHAIQQQT